MLAAHVLAVHLPRAAPERAEIFNVLSSEVNRFIANLAVRDRPGDVGKVQRAAGPDIQPLRRHGELQRK